LAQVGPISKEEIRGRCEGDKGRENDAFGNVLAVSSVQFGGLQKRGDSNYQ